MSLYTPPHTPSSSHAMNATLPPLPIELLSTWSTWRPPVKPEPPLTPPLSVIAHRRVPQSTQHLPTSLPSIACFDRHLARLSPITPPPTEHTARWHAHSTTELKLPPVQSQRLASPEHSPMDASDEDYDEVFKRSPSPHPPQVNLDWLAPSTHRSSHFIAEKTCEMICYLWFSALSKTTSSPSKRSRCVQSTYFPKSDPATASLQFAVSPSFIRFMQKVLETTQVSQSVIVLSLHYIYRLKMRNSFTNGQAGSEYRVAIGALMLANKFVDDNTYTNKTWSEVSGIDLAELNRMEREFLLGIDFDLYVDKTTYESWLNLLKGLVMSKEKDSRVWRRSRSNARLPPRSRLVSMHPTRLSSTHRPVAHRARSSSPSRTLGAYPFSTPPVQPTPAYLPPLSQGSHYPTPPRSGAKRTAEDAFSPTSASFPPIKPPKRAVGLSLEIPELTHTAPSTASSISPSEPLQSFSKLSLSSGASPVVVRNATESRQSPAWQGSVGHDQVPQTLVSAYRVDDHRSLVAPQTLYFYSLAGSPMDPVGDERNRKARLRYHQPPPPSSYTSQPQMPMVIQSATASPLHPHVSAAPTLPSFTDGNWQGYQNSSSHHGYHHRHHAPTSSTRECAVPAAPFANAGPPGVQFYSSNAQARLSPEYYWGRGRRV